MKIKYISIIVLIFLLKGSVYCNVEPEVSYISKLLFNYSQSHDSIKLKELFAKNNISTKNCLFNEFQLKKNNMTFNEFIYSVIDTTIIPQCTISKDKNNIQVKTSDYKAWLYGFLSVTVINGCASLGIIFLPLMRSRNFKLIMGFMIAMAVGSLAGSALLILLPDCFQLAELEKTSKSNVISYKWKATVAFGGIYMFYLLERLLKWIISSKEKKVKLEIECLHQGSMTTQRNSKLKISENSVEENDAIELKKDVANEKLEVVVQKSSFTQIAPVAWMIIVGDALHNFIDGLSIGAAFSNNIFKGVSLSIAVLCEELPHELGDFAILINAGMTVRQSVCWNMLSAMSCYVGFGIGMVLGELTGGSIWVFAVAGGMFLYISLVDMMPELNATLDDNKWYSSLSVSRPMIFLIQNVGLIVGFGVILLMSLYGENIEIQSH